MVDTDKLSSSRCARDGSDYDHDHDFKLEASGRVLRVGDDIINFTKSEGKILEALKNAAESGLDIEDIPILLNHSISSRSIHVAQAHISNIRRKIRLLLNGQTSIVYKEDHKRYVLEAQ